MNPAQFQEALYLLKQVRSEMHDDVDARVTEGLDKVIAILEDGLTAEGSNAQAKLALAKLGEALKYLPFIKSLFEDLM